MARFAIVEAAGAPDIAACRELFTEYQQSLGVSLCFQGFDRELAGLPGDYAPPAGALLLARAGAQPAGCVALRPLAGRDAEIKRLYVRPRFRGFGLGRVLVDEVISRARRQGYEWLRLDTLPQLETAQRLYEQLGFADAPRYNDNPLTGVRFMALDLRRAASATS